MSNKTEKPKKSAKELIQMLRDQKGVLFDLMCEDEAERYLIDRNNYLRTASYRKNYEKRQTGPNKGKYIGLDFAYLAELSRIDLGLREILLQMCIDIEHALKVALVSDVERNSAEDGYEIVNSFLNLNPDILHNIAGKAESIFTGDLIRKYFDLCYVFEGEYIRTEIAAIDCPIWVLVEILAFKDFLRLLSYYESVYPGRILYHAKLLNTVRSLRNACAHNNCILLSVRPGSTSPNYIVSRYISQIDTVGKEERKNKLTCRPLYEIACLVMEYDTLVSDHVRRQGVEKLKNFVHGRMAEHSDYFADNQVLSTSFGFIRKVVDNLK